MEEFVGPFRLVREIGRGHNAVVYEAHDTRRDEAVALKVLHLAEADPETGQPAPHAEATLMRFVREADAIRRLQHPNIVRIRDAGSDGGRLYIAMERLHGETLRARVASCPLPPALAACVAQQIAGALSLAHSLGIYHRDIKPDNIFLLSDGTAKLMDFGAARIASEFSLTQTGNVIGSPAYMAPEQVVGEECDARTDVWGLGATLFESVTGQKPFPGDTVTAVMYAILHKRPDFSHVPSAPLAAVLERALSKRQAARHATMNEFALDLRRVADAGSNDGPRVVGRRSTSTNTTALLSRLGRRPAALLPLAVGAAGALALLLAGATLLPRHGSKGAERNAAVITPPPVTSPVATSVRAKPAAPPTTPVMTPNVLTQLPRQTAGTATKAPAPSARQTQQSPASVATIRSGAGAGAADPSTARADAVLVVERPTASQQPAANPPLRHSAASGPRKARAARNSHGAGKDTPASPRVVVAAVSPPGRTGPGAAAQPRRAAQGSSAPADTAQPRPTLPLVYERPARPGEDRPAEEIPGATPMPRLPRGLRVRGGHIDVSLNLYINADGVVERSVILRPSGITEVDDLAQQTVLSWEFFPALKDGVPVASEQPVEVTLDRAGPLSP